MTWISIAFLTAVVGIISVHLSDIKDELRKIRKLKEKEGEK